MGARPRGGGRCVRRWMNVSPNSSNLRPTTWQPAAADRQEEEGSSSSAAAPRLPASALSPRGQTAAGPSSLASRAALPPIGAAAQQPSGPAPSHGSSAASRAGQPAQGRASVAGAATYLEVHRRLTQGDKLPDVCRALGLNVHTAQHYFNEAARLLVSSRADSLLRSADDTQRRAFEAMPRALRPIGCHARRTTAAPTAPGRPDTGGGARHPRCLTRPRCFRCCASSAKVPMPSR